MECLMIKRASVTVYNAQESDTFGKDAELGVTLAQRKPGIVYVTRMFLYEQNVARVYNLLDNKLRVPRDQFVERLLQDGLLEQHETAGLLGPEKTKADAMGFVIRKNVTAQLRGKDKAELALELVRQGYSLPESDVDLADYCLDRIVNLEKRALIFREIHPLSLQTSPFDGVARGVMVTRTIEDTATLLSGLLRNAVEYEIVNENDNWLLIDKNTQSPVRVVTNNQVLTTAFWSESWGAS